MKRITLTKTMLAALIALISLMSMSGCNWGHDDHHGDSDHHGDYHDNH